VSGNRAMAGEKSKLWGAADAYEQYMGRWSRKIAPLFLEWLAPPQRKNWIDIGCGTGQLSLQIASKCNPSHHIGVDQTEGFLSLARKNVPNAEFTVGDALSIDLPNDSVDYAVSGLLLNFVPDKAKALNEMARIARPEGVVALYVWDYAGHMQIMRYFFDAARVIDPKSSAFDDGINAPICRPKALADAFSAAGLSHVETAPIDIAAAFIDFQDYWEPFLGGTGSAPKYCLSLDEATRNEIRDAVRAKLPIGPDGEILLAVRAWAARGVVPA
jgi:SAM-dependent methyltransferase